MLLTLIETICKFQSGKSTRTHLRLLSERLTTRGQQTTILRGLKESTIFNCMSLQDMFLGTTWKSLLKNQNNQGALRRVNMKVDLQPQILTSKYSHQTSLTKSTLTKSLCKEKTQWEDRSIKKKRLNLAKTSWSKSLRIDKTNLKQVALSKTRTTLLWVKINWVITWSK